MGAEAFSSLQQGILVVLSDRVNWIPFAAALDELSRAADPVSFVWFRPWSPGALSKIGRFGDRFGAPLGEGHLNQLAIFSDGRPVVEQALTFVNSLGSSPGILLVGSTRDEAELQLSLRGTDVHSDDALFIAAECAAVVGFALGLDEGGRSTLMVRLTNSTVTLIDRLVDLLSAAADRIVSNESC